jgi:hypothetical protein
MHGPRAITTRRGDKCLPVPVPAFTFHSQFGCQDEGGGSALPGSEMKKMKRFVLITLTVGITIDLLALWMLWD